MMSLEEARRRPHIEVRCGFGDSMAVRRAAIEHASSRFQEAYGYGPVGLLSAYDIDRNERIFVVFSLDEERSQMEERQ